MGWCCKKPKRQIHVVPAEPPPQVQSQPTWPKPKTSDIIGEISRKTVKKNEVSTRSQIDILKLLPQSIDVKYEKLGLPYPSVQVDDFWLYAFMTVNLLRVDPVFFVNNFLETVRSRYSDSETYKSFSYSNSNGDKMRWVECSLIELLKSM